ncbi:MAG: thioredoxin-like domain-containing protein [Croceivirga sp.]
MKRIITNFILLSTIGIFAQQQTSFDFSRFKEEQSFEYTGSGMSHLEGNGIRLHTFDLEDPDGWVRISSDTIKDGKFALTGKIQAPRHVLLSVRDEEGPLYVKYLIAEPGKVTLTWNDDYGDLYIDGGEYNQKVTAKVEQNPKMLNASRASSNAEARMMFEQDTVKLYALNDIVEDFMKLRTDSFDDIRKNGDDPMARLLAMYWSNLPNDIYDNGAESVEKEIDALQDEIGLGEIPAITYIKNFTKRMDNARSIAGELQDGNTIKDFTAKTIDDKEINLNEEIEKSSYVLVDFWASWCGPCRQENPKMKKVYNAYKDKGFNIVAFSIDEDKEDWVSASKEDEIPWVNISDIQGYDSPIAEQYGIQSIPVNYLVDSTGKIVARNLRGDQLEKEIEALLGTK